MRIVLTTAFSVVALASAAVPAAVSAAPVPAVIAETADSISDGELTRFAAAMEAVRVINEAVENGTPSADQQAAMVAAIEAAGLDLNRFNAISTAVSGDAVVRARLALAATAPSPTGSAAAAVSDAEVDQFVLAMDRIRPLAEALDGAAPGADQQAAMAAAISSSGLALERFNVISGAVSADARLRARLAVADARRAG